MRYLFFLLALLTACTANNQGASSLPLEWEFIEMGDAVSVKHNSLPNLLLPLPAGSHANTQMVGISVGPVLGFNIYHSSEISKAAARNEIGIWNCKQISSADVKVQQKNSIEKIRIECPEKLKLISRAVAYKLVTSGHEYIVLPNAGMSDAQLSEIETSLLNALIK